MMIAIGSDHAGFPLKQEIKQFLDEQGVEYLDVGALSRFPAIIPTLPRRCAPRLRRGNVTRGCCFAARGLASPWRLTR